MSVTLCRWSGVIFFRFFLFFSVCSWLVFVCGVCTSLLTRSLLRSVALFLLGSNISPMPVTRQHWRCHSLSVLLIGSTHFICVNQSINPLFVWFFVAVVVLSVGVFIIVLIPCTSADMMSHCYSCNSRKVNKIEMNRVGRRIQRIKPLKRHGQRCISRRRAGK